MSLGTCVVKQGTTVYQAFQEQASIQGSLKGFIAEFTVRQVFQRPRGISGEMSYVASNDNKLCVYDTTIYVGTEVIKPKIEAKNVAEETYKEGKKAGRAVFYGGKHQNSLVEFRLGNIPDDVVVTVEVKLCVVVSPSGRNSIFVKFPLRISYPSAGIKSMLHDLAGEFDFEFNCSSLGDKITDLTSNTAGRYDKQAHVFQLTDKKEVDAIILTMKLSEPPKDDFIVAGNFMLVNLVADDVHSLISRTKTKTNNEFVFVVDCSGSMSGSRIEKARVCLDLFLRSLPMGSYFNVFFFGSSYKSLFNKCQEYNDANVQQALQSASSMRADLGGTELFPVLESIFAAPQKGIGQRQIFVLTDGEVSNVDRVLKLAEDNSDNNRIFTLGIGTGADPGLVQGLSDVSGGRSDFVVVSDQDFSEKVIPQLETSTSCSLTNINVQVEGHDDVECSVVPIRPLTLNGGANLVLKSPTPFKGDETVLITGTYGDESVDIPITSTHRPNEDRELARLVQVWFSHQRITSLEKLYRQCKEDQEKKKALENSIISLSKESGILTSLTAFVAVSEKKYAEPEKSRDNRQVWIGASCTYETEFYEEESEYESWGGMHGYLGSAYVDFSGDDCSDCFDSCSDASSDDCFDGGIVMLKCASPKAKACKRIAVDGAPRMCAVPKQAAPAAKAKSAVKSKQALTFELTSVTSLQNIRGYWEDLRSLEGFVGKFPAMLEEIRKLPGVSDVDQARAFNTVLAIAILRSHFMGRRASWVMIEKKALVWLSSVSAGANWESCITTVASKLKK